MKTNFQYRFNELHQTTIIVQRGYESRELTPFLIDPKFRISTMGKTGPANRHHPHIGSVEFCEQAIGPQTPDFYPEWTKPIWYRDINYIRPNSSHYFAKGVTQYKEGHHFVTGRPCGGGGNLKVYGQTAYSDLVNFVDEYRHYYLNGKELCSWWYAGVEEHSETKPNGQPIENIEIPEDFCGTVDMGVLDSGEYALVEVHNHPYAIGRYGDDTDRYKEFLVVGWRSKLI